MDWWAFVYFSVYAYMYCIVLFHVGILFYYVIMIIIVHIIIIDRWYNIWNNNQIQKYDARLVQK